VNLTLLGGLGSFLFTVVSFVVAVLTLRSRRKDREAVNAREAADLGIVMLQWSWKVRRLAALNGWDQDPGWPALPVEATPEYLRGKASSSDNDELNRFVDLAQKIAKGDGK
jgi:hypothetical protein